MNDNFKYFMKNDFVGYEGKWIAIQNSKVVYSYYSLKQLLKKLIKFGISEQCLITRIPKIGEVRI